MVLELVIIVVLVLLIAGFGVVKYRSRPQQAEVRKVAPPIPLAPRAQALKLKENGRFWGYKIEPHCGASSRLTGRQYEIDESPPLPVEGCGSSPCSCCLIGLPNRRRHGDRRSGMDRRGSLRMESIDRRSDRPRRREDLHNWAAYGHL